MMLLTSERPVRGAVSGVTPPRYPAPASGVTPPSPAAFTSVGVWPSV